ncbi:hypothetical protein NIASO_07195 [Niabella soli DSM 19437]|uniref:Uncharacterized protein n=1 Tax=Niabella soli DSM 19437 TaxID=929713 RepID=W0F7U4_9BACT|nr:hypothetical protein NIASO_07195 [Niabella soli DSM 19437]
MKTKPSVFPDPSFALPVKEHAAGPHKDGAPASTLSFFIKQLHKKKPGLNFPAFLKVLYSSYL